MHGPFSSRPVAEHRTEDGALSLWQPRPGLVLTRITGRFTHELALPMMAYFDDETAGRQLDGLHDWTPMTGFDPTLPPRLIAFTLRVLPRSKRILIASLSPMISMAVRTANLTLRRVELVESQGALNDAAQRALVEP